MSSEVPMYVEAIHARLKTVRAFWNAVPCDPENGPAESEREYGQELADDVTALLEHIAAVEKERDVLLERYVELREAEDDNIALRKRIKELEMVLQKLLYERICECGDFESQHQGGGPCGVCCQSEAPYDGCEIFRPAGYEKLRDAQKTLHPIADQPKETP